MNGYKVALTKTVVKRALLGRDRQPLLGAGVNSLTDRRVERWGSIQIRMRRSKMPICRSLRSKGMYVFTDGQEPDADDDDDCGSTVYWCFHTMKSFGPDDSMVGRRQCRNAVARATSRSDWRE